MLIGVDLDNKNITAARIKNYQIEEHINEAIQQKDEQEALIHQISRLINHLLVPEVSGIGLGVPSVVNTRKGIVYNVQNISSWEEVPLKSIYEEQFQLPVYVNNDANCFAFGEKHFGRGKNYDSIAGVIIGSGMGAGLILNGKLYEGPNCGAGEVGMLPYRESIMEHYCSEIFFDRRQDITGAEALQLASSGNTEVKALFDEFGVHLGIALEAIIYAYDPEIIILGGELSTGYQFFKNTMYSSLESFAFRHSLNNLKIEVSGDDYSTVKGAATLALEDRSGF
jgi:glucokinase